MVTQRKKTALLSLAALGLMLAAVLAHYRFDPWGFYWKIPETESALRMQVVQTAEAWIGANEADGSHRAIIDRYNRQEVLPMGYAVQYGDSWCAAFVSAVALECGLEEVIPPECGCERQIGLFQELGRWEERDDAIPLPGDLIFYDWNMEEKGECTGWADHVGLVVGTKWPFVKVIEGNYEDRVQYRWILLDDVHIRGYALPDYSTYIEKMPQA